MNELKKCFEKFVEERTIGRDVIGKLLISTVELPVVHCMLEHGNPNEAWFETMVFTNDYDYQDIECFRYRTIEDAENGHKEVVKTYKELENESTRN